SRVDPMGLESPMPRTAPPSAPPSSSGPPGGGVPPEQMLWLVPLALALFRQIDPETHDDLCKLSNDWDVKAFLERPRRRMEFQRQMSSQKDDELREKMRQAWLPLAEERAYIAKVGSL